jgi:accessory gene regulator protein AgrB
MLIKKIVNCICTDVEEYEIYEYGVKTSLELICSTITSLIISALIGQLIEGIFVICIFMTIRSCAGGLHFHSFLVCYLVSNINILLCLIYGLSDQQLNSLGAFFYIMIIAIIIVIFAPVESELNPLDISQAKAINRKIKRYIAVLMILTIIFFLNGNEQYIKLIIATLSIIVLSMFIEIVMKNVCKVGR